MKGLRFAFGFLTSIPISTPAPQPGDLSRAGIWFPFVGLILGAGLVAAQWLLTRVFSPLLAAALMVTLWAMLTGGLHLDGLADCCDGLLATASPERRLEIMRDPRLGAFGGAGLILFLILKVLAVASLPVPSSVALMLAPASARWLMLIVARQPSARPGGLGAAFSQGLTRSVYIGAAIIPIVLIALGGWRAVIAGAVAHVVMLGIIRLARTRIGGVTGDVFGLTIELSELVALLVYSAAI